MYMQVFTVGMRCCQVSFMLSIFCLLQFPPVSQSMVYCGGDGGDRSHVCMTCMHIVCLQLSGDVLYIAVHILACKARKSQSGGTMPLQRITVVIIFGADASCKYLKCTALAEVSSRPPLCFRSSLIRAPASNIHHNRTHGCPSRIML